MSLYFTVYYTLSILIIVALLNTQSDFTGLVDFETLKKVTKLFETDILTAGVIEESFSHLDINDDGYLSLHQFFNFVSRTAILWKPLYYFRITLLEIFFPDGNYANIFTRKLNLKTTVDYMINHNGDLPSQGCKEWLMRKLKGMPHPLKCDYSEDLSRNSNNRPSIMFSDLTEIFIKLYSHDYTLAHESFSSKHLKSFTTTETLSNIDYFYVLLKKRYRWKESLSSITYSSIEFNFKTSTSGAKKSILKQSSARHSSRYAITPMPDELVN